MKIKYKKELNKIIANQNKLQNQLAKLKIIQTKALQKQRELANRKLNTKKLTKIDNVKVKNYGNIYMKTRTIRYRGNKTIPPVRGVITKKFGAYTDPVYHIALYNDSITIKTKPNTKVRAIFSGTVVFVGNTSDGKMIVIKHRNHLHSIYAKLAKISPFIKKGYRVKKGEIIAKVNNELEFEITYKTLPINPLKVVNF
jgi:murein DD-endopeptidase MepM/ murein hydrolase activator NlpD